MSAAASIATLSFIEENHLLENARNQGEYMMRIFNEWKEKYEIVGDVRGKGLMIGVELVKDKKTKAFGQEEASEVISRAWKRGVLLITAGKSTLRVVPPLTITRELVDEALGVTEACVKEVNKESLKRKRSTSKLFCGLFSPSSEPQSRDWESSSRRA